jgi:hypothetical protein
MLHIHNIPILPWRERLLVYSLIAANRAVLAFKLFLAHFRLSKRLVCELSAGRERWNDFHDYRDGKLGYPAHFHVHTCKRCGKEFTI